MSSNPLEDREFVADLTKEIVAEVAPEELDIFDSLLQEYYENPQPPDASAGASDDPLGFGLGETLIAVTPAATAMVYAVTSYILEAAVSQFKDEGAEFARNMVKKLFQERRKKKKTGKEPGAKEPGEAAEAAEKAPDAAVSAPPPLTQEQLKHAHEVAIAEARRFGMNEAQALVMADALLRGLVLS